MGLEWTLVNCPSRKDTISPTSSVRLYSLHTDQ
jgi:hypothetical protein